jgi:lipopolysaccharide transport system permease protein
MNDLPGTDRAIRSMQRQSLFTTSADRGWGQRFQLAARDIREGFTLWRLVWALGLSDIKLRYRGSTLGPFWLTLSTAIMIGAMGFLYADLFHTDIHSYLPYLATSIILWNYLSILVSDGCTCFTSSESLIKGTRMPFTVHALRSVVRNTIVLAHNVIVIVGVYVIMGVPISFYMLWAIPGLMLWLIDGFAIALLFGALCARFRDVPQIIASVMQIAFFVTPVMWNAKILESSARGSLLIHFNPFFYIVEIVRAPLLGTPLAFDMVAKTLIITAVIVATSAIAFARTRGRVAYWM